MPDQISCFARSDESIAACRKMIWTMIFAITAVCFGLLAPTLMKAATYNRLFSGDALWILICYPLGTLGIILLARLLSRSVADDELQLTEQGIRLRRLGFTRSIKYNDIREVLAATNNLKPVTRIKLRNRSRFDISEAFVSFEEFMRHFSSEYSQAEDGSSAVDDCFVMHIQPRKTSRTSIVLIILGTLVICGSAAIFAIWSFKSDPEIARTAVIVIPIVLIGAIYALANQSRRFSIEHSNDRSIP